MGRHTSLGTDKRGITGLEMAIVLTALVVVASVFALAVRSTGLISSEQNKETAVSLVEEVSATLSLRGEVVANVNTALTGVDTLKFTLGNASKSVKPVEISDKAMILTYVDEDQALNIAASNWTATWLTGSGAILDPGEQVEIVVTLTGLNPRLGKSKEFSIQIKPQKGAVLLINRTMPAELLRSLDLN